MTRQEILEACAKRFGVSLDDMRQKHRKNVIRLARQAAMYEMRAAETWTLGQIARFLEIDKATVLHGADEHARRNSLPPLERAPAPDTRRKPINVSTRIVTHAGAVDALRYGRIQIGPSQLAFRFDRLSGKVRLFKQDVTGSTPMTEVFSPAHLEAARLACVEKFGVVA